MYREFSFKVRNFRSEILTWLPGTGMPRRHLTCGFVALISGHERPEMGETSDGLREALSVRNV